MVPFRNYFIECLGLLLCEGRQAKVIDNEQLWFEKRSHGFFIGVLNPCGSQFSEELGRRYKQSRVAASAPTVTQRLRQMSLAGAGRAIQDYVFFALNEYSGCQILYLFRIDARQRREVELFDSFVFLECRLFQLTGTDGINAFLLPGHPYLAQLRDIRAD